MSENNCQASRPQQHIRPAMPRKTAAVLMVITSLTASAWLLYCCKYFFAMTLPMVVSLVSLSLCGKLHSEHAKKLAILAIVSFAFGIVVFVCYGIVSFNGHGLPAFEWFYDYGIRDALQLSSGSIVVFGELVLVVMYYPRSAKMAGLAERDSLASVCKDFLVCPQCKNDMAASVNLVCKNCGTEYTLDQLVKANCVGLEDCAKVQSYEN